MFFKILFTAYFLEEENLISEALADYFVSARNYGKSLWVGLLDVYKRQVLLFISDIMVFAVYENMQRKSEERMKVNMERQREDINRDYDAVLDKQNENMHIMVHDIKNHLGVIESIADNDKVTAYIRCV